MPFCHNVDLLHNFLLYYKKLKNFRFGFSDNLKKWKLRGSFCGAQVLPFITGKSKLALRYCHSGMNGKEIHTLQK